MFQHGNAEGSPFLCCVAVGPILVDSYPPLTEDLQVLLHRRQRVLYLALGSHVILSNERYEKLVMGVMKATMSTLIDEAIGSIRDVARKKPDRNHVLYDKHGRLVTADDLLEGGSIDWVVLPWVPLRTVLNHPHLCIYLKHKVASSTNEVISQGISAICLGVYVDQPSYAIRMRDAGAAEIYEVLVFAWSRHQFLCKQAASVTLEHNKKFCSCFVLPVKCAVFSCGSLPFMIPHGSRIDSEIAFDGKAST